MCDFSERSEGPTPAGGAYALAIWLDDDGELTTKALATRVEVLEFDASDRVIFRTYGRVASTSE